MNKHINKNKPAKKKVNYGKTPVLITSAACSSAEVKEALKSMDPGQISVLEPQTEPRKISVREAILQAKTIEEVSNFLTVGAAFENASPKTQRRWERAAKIRCQQLGAALTAEEREAFRQKAA